MSTVAADPERLADADQLTTGDGGLMLRSVAGIWAAPFRREEKIEYNQREVRKHAESGLPNVVCAKCRGLSAAYRPPPNGLAAVGAWPIRPLNAAEKALGER